MDLDVVYLDLLNLLLETDLLEKLSEKLRGSFKFIFSLEQDWDFSFCGKNSFFWSKLFFVVSDEILLNLDGDSACINFILLS